jgi:arachidonate 15-lipoxygenase
MALGYDRSFAPYVLPSGIPLDRQSLPDTRWATAMAFAQARGLLAAGLTRAREWLPRGGPAILDRLHARVASAADGRIPVTGDAEFAYHRFAGQNPLLVRRVRELEEIPEALRIGDELLTQVLGGGSAFTQRVNREPAGAKGAPALARRVANGDVFIAHHDLPARSESDLQRGKFVAPTASLYCHAPEMDAPFPVVPLAIQCPIGRADGATVVLTPLSERRWRAAKKIVGVADVHVAELWLHLARAHFMTVPFAIALRRRLPVSHPLHAFLIPHLRFNVFVDRMAWVQGVRDTSGVLIRSLAGNADWSQDVAKRLYYEASFREQHFERDLEARGLARHSAPYPYRDDGRLLWCAIARFVGAYVAATYRTEAALEADATLHAFLGEVGDPHGGNVRGLFERGARVGSRDELVEIVTQVLFVAGPLHALAHYGSAAQLQFADESPAWLEGNPLSTLEDADALPSQWNDQVSRVVGTNCRYDTLGEFSRHALGEQPGVRAMIAQFQDDLARVEATISARNEQRLAPFLHFLPSRIPNGITV